MSGTVGGVRGKSQILTLMRSLERIHLNISYTEKH